MGRESARLTHRRLQIRKPRFYTPEVILILGGFCVTGIASLIYQVAWTRIFSLLLGSSVYAFSLILTAFIFGLGLGTFVFARIVGRFKDLKKVFGWLQVGIGLSALAALPFFGKVPLINRWVYLNWGLDFTSIQWSNFLIIHRTDFCSLHFSWEPNSRWSCVWWHEVSKHWDIMWEQRMRPNTVGTILGFT